MRGQNKIFKIILLLGDIFVIYVALFLALLIRSKNLLGQFDSFFYRSVLLYILWVFVIYILSLYDINFFKKKIDFLYELVVFSILAFFIGVTYFYFRPTFGITPKTILLLNLLIFDILFLFWRYLFNLFLEARRIKERVAIVGSHDRLDEISAQIQRIYSIETIFCPTNLGQQGKCSALLSGLKIISEIENFKNIVIGKKITSIIFALDFYSNKNLVKDIFDSLPLTLNYIGIEDLYESITKKISLDHLNEIWFLEKISKPINIFEQGVKRIFDVIFSIVGLLVFLIFLPFIALAIKIEDKGHIFYFQKRVGINGKIFMLYKFRTMAEDRNQDKEIWREKNKDNIYVQQLKKFQDSEEYQKLKT